VLRDRAKCRCPALSEQDLDIMYDPFTIMANAVDPTPLRISKSINCPDNFIARDGSLGAGALALNGMPGKADFYSLPCRRTTIRDG
jgi:hypothetical protein